MTKQKRYMWYWYPEKWMAEIDKSMYKDCSIRKIEGTGLNAGKIGYGIFLKEKPTYYTRYIYLYSKK